MEVGGNTPCVEVRAGPHLLIVDAGTGIINLGDSLMEEHFRRPGASGEPIIATILLSHTHHDHIQGFPFFVPNHVSTSQIYLYGPKLLDTEIDEVLRETMTPPFFPVELHDLEGLRLAETVRPGDVLTFDGTDEPPTITHPIKDAGAPPEVLRVRIMKSFAHPKGGVYVFRIEYQGKSVVYASDIESYHGMDTRLALFAQGADVLIHDAQYTHKEYAGAPFPKQGYGHSTPEMATAMAEAAGAKRLFLFHHDPLHSDAQLRRMEQKAQRAFPKTWVAREDEEIEV